MLNSIEFAVVDVETTGFFPERHDKIVEIAIVQVDETGRTLDEFCTLVNPDRDVGPTHIHQITTRDVLNAPKFEEVAGDIVARIAGRVFVAHNVTFDLRFLRAELAHAGHGMPDTAYLDTMTLVKRIDVDLPRRNLKALCHQFGIHRPIAHSALCDATATATLLAICIDRLGGPDRLSLSDIGVKGSLVDHTQWPQIPASGRSSPRSEGSTSDEAGDSFISRLVARLPATSQFNDNIERYFGLLDRVLEDRRVTIEESRALELIASEEGLSKESIIEAHRAYMRDLIRIAWEDGIVTPAEHRDLEEVRCLLGIARPEYDKIFEAMHTGSISTGGTFDSVRIPGLEIVGRTICFTGTFRCQVNGQIAERSFAERTATEKGMEVKNSVTKKLDYLVTSDPDSMSGKAKKARQYGTRILAENVFWRMMQVPVD